MLLFVQAALLVSCSGNDYLNAIPAKSTALISIDLQQFVGNDVSATAPLLKQMLHVDNADECGLDVKEKLYLFENKDGALGLCAKIKSEKDVEKWLASLSGKHLCTTLTERKGFHFCVLKDTWLVGFSDKAFLVMGPVVAEAQPDLQRQMARMLSADDEQGVKNSPLFTCLDSLSAPMAMVAQAKALPEKFVAPFTLGAPKGTDASQIIIAAEMLTKENVLHIEGKSFSLNKQLDKALQQSLAHFRPVSDTYVKLMPQEALMGMFVNVDGRQFLPMLQNNDGVQTLLMGVNTAIDMDNILRSVDGNLSVVIPAWSDEVQHINLSAQLAHTDWLKDVDYWKQSCPKGTQITDCGKNTFCYSDGKSRFFFGVTDDKQFLSGSEVTAVVSPQSQAVRTLPKSVQQLIVGKRMAMVLHLPKAGKQGGEATEAVMSMVQPLFGTFNTVVYTMK